MAALATLPLVKALVPEAIFRRGKEIAAAGKLRHVQFEGTGLEKAVATCIGSNEGDNYRLSIAISGESPSKPECECSCPAAAKFKGNLCKHLVALLLLRVKELAKSSRVPNEASVMAEKSAEVVKPIMASDSQSTEPWIDSQETHAVMDNACSSHISISSVTGESKKRILPTWMLVGDARTGAAEQQKGKGSGLPNSKKAKRNVLEDSDNDVDEDISDIKEAIARESTSYGRKRNAKKDGNSAIEEFESRGVAGRSDAVSHKMKRLKGKESNYVEGLQEQNLTLTNAAVKKKRIVKRQENDDLDKDLCDKDILSNKKEYFYPHIERKKCSGRGTHLKNRNGLSTIGGNGQKRVLQGEGDLTDEDVPEVDDPFQLETSNDNSRLDMDLTTEDLVAMAKKHLEQEQGSGLPDRGDLCQQRHLETDAQRNAGSVFSVHEWKKISTINVDVKDTVNEHFSGSRDHSRFSSTLNGDGKDIGNATGQGSIVDEIEKKGKTPLQSSDNVAEDMLNLFFGPSLSVTASAEYVQTQDFMEDRTRNLVHANVQQEPPKPDLVPSVSVEVPMIPKKKGSLKDKVKMLLS